MSKPTRFVASFLAVAAIGAAAFAPLSASAGDTHAGQPVSGAHVVSATNRLEIPLYLQLNGVRSESGYRDALSGADVSSATNRLEVPFYLRRKVSGAAPALRAAPRGAETSVLSNLLEVPEYLRRNTI